ncbi:D-lyxose/D-mannose family sugar isomerase [Salibacterium aidingense]|uniref:D-lyxose/D-mannose family sugar isomerase n=1 Tax=Salibacterium aidingense TaxID=384933 RepID=UPI000406974C|nr:D-lyxose/D-mannose family sugar isomerase [Salibacterium aidingense]
MYVNKEYVEEKRKVIQILEQQRIILSASEKENVEIADFGLKELEKQGLQLIVYINNDFYCAKELILFPGQTCPEHRHPPVNGKKGKLETFRCRQGEVFLYVEGERSSSIDARLPIGSEHYYTVFQEVKLKPGQSYTIPPNTLHWFQAGREGAIVSEFSTTSMDEYDVFTDPRIIRKQKPL